MHMKVIRFFRLILLASGSIFFLFAVIFGVQTAKFIGGGEKARATIVANELKTDRDGDRNYYPRFVFLTNDGSSTSVQSSTGTNPPSFSEGQEVTVIYDRSKPGDARIDTFTQLWFLSLVLGFIGVGHLFISWLILLFSRRHEKKVLASA
jgi:hypothetical protein